jgi:methylated-DNA-[protein]-cysteine S-methyltransferase
MTSTGPADTGLETSVSVDPLALRDALGRAAARADAEGLVDVAWTRHDTPIGSLLLAATETGVVLISFESSERATERLALEVSARVMEGTDRLDPTRRELDEYFAGTRLAFDLPLDWQLSRGFRREVLAELVEVPYGRTVSYKDLAVASGRPQAFRAVGSAMSTNPLPVVVPCHRVLTSSGQLGGYAGGTDAKSWLLALEANEGT